MSIAAASCAPSRPPSGSNATDDVTLLLKHVGFRREYPKSGDKEYNEYIIDVSGDKLELEAEGFFNFNLVPKVSLEKLTRGGAELDSPGEVERLYRRIETSLRMIQALVDPHSQVEDDSIYQALISELENGYAFEFMAYLDMRTIERLPLDDAGAQKVLDSRRDDIGIRVSQQRWLSRDYLNNSDLKWAIHRPFVLRFFAMVMSERKAELMAYLTAVTKKLNGQRTIDASLVAFIGDVARQFEPRVKKVQAAVVVSSSFSVPLAVEPRGQILLADGDVEFAVFDAIVQEDVEHLPIAYNPEYGGALVTRPPSTATREAIRDDLVIMPGSVLRVRLLAQKALGNDLSRVDNCLALERLRGRVRLRAAAHDGVTRQLESAWIGAAKL